MKKNHSTYNIILPPPIPAEIESTTPTQRETATAASIAFPPRYMMSLPIYER